MTTRIEPAGARGAGNLRGSSAFGRARGGTSSSDGGIVAATARLAAAAMTILAVACPPAAAARHEPDFSGTWILDRPHSDAASKTPWGHGSADRLLIYETATELTLSIDDRVYRFVLDDVPHSHVDGSMGKLPNSIRTTETQATWEGAKLILKITEVARVTHPGSGVVSYHPGITRVHILALSHEGARLTMERTGYRHDPPTLLHGLPYSRATDRAYVHQKLLYTRSE